MMENAIGQDVCNAEHAEHYFPRTNWEAGENALSLAQFDWDAKTRRMLFGGCDIPYGQPAAEPELIPFCTNTQVVLLETNKTSLSARQNGKQNRLLLAVLSCPLLYETVPLSLCSP